MKRIYLRDARRRAGLTQKQLEAKAHVDQANISKLERNAHARPEFETVRRLARALGVPAESLRFGHGEAVL